MYPDSFRREEVAMRTRTEHENRRVLPASRRLNLAGRKIGIFGRGGSGKSTVSLLLARALVRSGYSVALLDADSTNEGLADALGLQQPPLPLIEHFGGMVFGGGVVTCPVEDPTPLAGGEISLAHLPEPYVGTGVDGVYLLLAGKMGKRGAGAGCDGPMAKIARDLRLRAEGDNLVTLVDFKAGFEDTARGVVVGLDRAIVVVNPTLAAMEMAADMQRAIEKLHGEGLPETSHLGSRALVALAHSLYRKARIRGVWCLLSNVPDERTERYLRQRLAERRVEPLGVIHTDKSIADSWLEASVLDSESAIREAELIVEKLEIEEKRRTMEASDAA
jgi:CO dehydrogenase nickel-insertion accessory protein CooC1